MSDSHSSHNDLFDCAICLEIYQRPVMLFCCGNTFCEKCILEVQNVCPYCRHVTNYNRNLAVEQMITSSSKFCACGKSVLVRDEKKHQDECYAVNKKCRYCDYIGNSEQRTLHGIEMHPDIITSMFLIYRGK